MSLSTIRIAATADLHVRSGDDLTYLREAFVDLGIVADVLVIAGDLVDVGRVAEMEALTEVLAEITIPVFAVLGNHDRRGMRKVAMTKVLRAAGVRVFDGTGAVVVTPDRPTLGVAGVTGTGGGFRPDGEEIGHSARFTRAAMVKSRRESAALRRALRELAEKQPDVTLVMTHFSPTESTMGDEPVLKYWMLGNALLGRTIDEFAPSLVVHGHAHLGNECGQTLAGVPVRNVAAPVTGGIRLLELAANGEVFDNGLRPLAVHPERGGVRENADVT